MSEAKARARARAQRHRYALCANVGSLQTLCHRLVVVHCGCDCSGCVYNIIMAQKYWVCVLVKTFKVPGLPYYKSTIIPILPSTNSSLLSMVTIKTASHIEHTYAQYSVFHKINTTLGIVAPRVFLTRVYPTF